MVILLSFPALLGYIRIWLCLLLRYRNSKEKLSTSICTRSGLCKNNDTSTMISDWLLIFFFQEWKWMMLGQEKSYGKQGPLLNEFMCKYTELPNLGFQSTKYIQGISVTITKDFVMVSQHYKSVHTSIRILHGNKTLICSITGVTYHHTLSFRHFSKYNNYRK